MIVLARSRIETFGKCPRRWYHSYAQGWMGNDTSTDLRIGIWLHTGLETLLRTGDLSSALDAIPTPEGENEEHIALARALLLGWYRVRWPSFQEEYTILSIEKEVLMPIAPGMVLMVRADAVVREKETGRVVVFNWKSTNRTANWTDKWRRDIQMWTEALGTEQDLKEPVSHVIVEGFYKGVFRDGHWATPLLWGHKRETADGEWKYSEKRVPTWTKFPTWKEAYRGADSAFEPLAVWIGGLSTEVLDEYFIRSSPIFRNDEVVEEWLRGVVRRESDAQNLLQEASERDKLDFFKQEFSQWNCNWCPFWDVCSKASTIEALVEAGQLVKRESPVDNILARFREGE